MDEVVSCGAEAVLPQNLNDEWLDRLYVGAKHFISLIMQDIAEDEENIDKAFEDEYSMLLLTAVLEIVHQQSGYVAERPEIPEMEIIEKMKCYSLSVVLETIGRITDVRIDPPSLDTIFDKERIIEFESQHPEITAILNKI